MTNVYLEKIAEQGNREKAYYAASAGALASSGVTEAVGAYREYQMNKRLTSTIRKAREVAQSRLDRKDYPGVEKAVAKGEKAFLRVKPKIDRLARRNSRLAGGLAASGVALGALGAADTLKRSNAERERG